MEEVVWQAWLVWLLPLAGSLLIPLFGRINVRFRSWLAVAIGFASALNAASMIPQVWGGNFLDLKLSVSWLQLQDFSVELGVLLDPLSVFMANIATWIGAIVLLYSIGYMAHQEGLDRYYSLMLLFIGAMTGLVMADNFLQLFLFWEIVGVCSYALIGFWYDRPRAVQAGIKAFLVTRAGDVCLLIGILSLFSGVQSFNYIDISAWIANPGTNPSFMTITLIFLSLGAMGKSAQVPFHVWLPDAMEGPTPVSALIHAATMVKAGIYLLARCSLLAAPLALTQSSNIHLWCLMIVSVGSITALLSSTLALVSKDIKRVLAYSTISQLGYMVSAIGFGTPNSLFASQLHVFTHAAFKALLFLCAGSVVHTVATTDMREMGGLKKHMPVTFTTSLVGLLALSGVPPLSGFWSKDLILDTAISAGYNFSVLLLITSAAITLAYSIRWLYLAFLGEERYDIDETRPHESPTIMLISLVALASISMIGGVLVEPLSEYFGVSDIETGSIHTFTITALALITGGASSYYTYFKKAVPSKTFQKGLIDKIRRFLLAGYYFDSLYNLLFVEGVSKIEDRVIAPFENRLLGSLKIVGEAGLKLARVNARVDTSLDKLTYLMAEGTVRLGVGLHKYVDVGLDKLTYLMAEGTVSAGRGLYDYIDVGLDRLTYSIAEGAVYQSERVRKTDTGSVQRYVLAIMLGFILLTILMLSTTS